MSKRGKGFTIMEIMVVLIIIGALGAIAWGRFTSIPKKMQSQEGVNILTQLYGAEIRYKLYNNSFTATLSDLDVEVRTPKYFNAPYLNDNLGGDTISCSAGNKQWIAGIDPKSGEYSLRALVEGSVVCTPCSSVICQKMGYPTNW